MNEQRRTFLTILSLSGAGVLFLVLLVIDLVRFGRVGDELKEVDRTIAAAERKIGGIPALADRVRVARGPNRRDTAIVPDRVEMAPLLDIIHEVELEARRGGLADAPNTLLAFEGEWEEAKEPRRRGRSGKKEEERPTRLYHKTLQVSGSFPGFLRFLEGLERAIERPQGGRALQLVSLEMPESQGAVLTPDRLQFEMRLEFATLRKPPPAEAPPPEAADQAQGGGGALDWRALTALFRPRHRDVTIRVDGRRSPFVLPIIEAPEPPPEVPVQTTAVLYDPEEEAQALRDLAARVATVEADFQGGRFARAREVGGEIVAGVELSRFPSEAGRREARRLVDVVRGLVGRAETREVFGQVPLSVQFIAWSGTGGRSVVSLNRRAFVVGDETPMGVRVEEIRERDIVVSFRGERFELPLGWTQGASPQ